MAIVGQKFIPGVLDEYLGKTGYKSQQIPDEPKDPNAPNNLYQYVPGVHSARGKFAGRSSRTSAEIFLSLHPESLALGTAAALTFLGGVLVARRKVS